MSTKLKKSRRKSIRRSTFQKYRKRFKYINKKKYTNKKTKEKFL